MGGTEITIVGMLVAAITTLSSVVGYLYNVEKVRFEKELSRVDNKLMECEHDRDTLWQRYNGLAMFVARQFGMTRSQMEEKVNDECKNEVVGTTRDTDKKTDLAN